MPYTVIKTVEINTTNLEDYQFSIHVDQSTCCFSDTIDIDFEPKSEDFDGDSETFDPSQGEMNCLKNGMFWLIDEAKTLGFDVDWTRTDYGLCTFYLPKHYGRNDESFTDGVMDGKIPIRLSQEDEIKFQNMVATIKTRLLNLGLKEFACRD